MVRCRDCEIDCCEWGELPSGKDIMLEPWSGALPPHLRVFTLVRGKANRATAQDVKLHRPLYVCHWDVCSSRDRR